MLLISFKFLLTTYIFWDADKEWKPAAAGMSKNHLGATLKNGFETMLVSEDMYDYIAHA